MRHPSTKAIFAHWASLRGTRTAPSRAEIDPRPLAAHLGDMFLLDGAEKAHAVRFAGSRLEAELGGALAGLPFGALFSEQTRREALAALSLVTLEAEPVLLGIRLDPGAAPGETAERRPDAGQWVRPHWANRRPEAAREAGERRLARAGTGEMLLLPLNHRGKTGARVLGALGLNAPSLHLPARRADLMVTGERLLGPGALSVTGRGLASGATVIAREGIVRLFPGITFPLNAENDS